MQFDMRRYGSIVWAMLALAFLLLTGLWATGLKGDSSPLFPAVAVATLVSTFQLSGLWATLGGGPYWGRAFLSLVATFVVAAGGAVALAAVEGLSEIVPLWRIAIAVWVSNWFVTQVPSALLRLLFGWHFAMECQSEARRSSIRDLFGITAVVGVVFAIAQQGIAAAQPYTAEQWNLLWATVLWVVGLQQVVFWLAVFPFLLMAMRRGRDMESGCSRYAVMMVVVSLALLLSAGVFLFPPMVLFAGVAMGLFCVLLCLPLMFARVAGWELRSRAEASIVDGGISEPEVPIEC